MNKCRQVLVCGAVASMMAISAPTAVADDYVGGSIGRSQARIGENDLGNTGGSTETKDTAWKIFAGHKWNEYAGWEVAYADLGRVKATFPSFAGKETLETVAWSVALVGTWPIPATQLGLSAKLGPALSSTTATFEQTGFPTFKSENTQLGWMGGLGVKWQLAQSWSVRLEWERYWKVGKNFTGGAPIFGNGSGYDVDVLSLGGAFHF